MTQFETNFVADRERMYTQFFESTDPTRRREER